MPVSTPYTQPFNMSTASGDYSQDTTMPVDPARAKVLGEKFSSVVSRISSTLSQAPISNSSKPVRLVAVSKLKPANDILALHSAPHNHLYFGENYAQELQSKAEILPKDIRWCFIGALQTNKCKPLARDVRNLWCVSSVDSEKKAGELEKGRKAAAEQAKEEDGSELRSLRVHTQVNTSGEAEKSGVEPEEAVKLCKYIRDDCPHLELAGLMTIGAIARSQATTEETENEDFVKLREVRDSICKELSLEEKDVELSMGMSADFESAIRCGSDEVRVGSTIFGERPPKKDAKVKDEVEDAKA